MQKVISFMHTTLDGYFADSKGDMNWAHRNSDDREWDNFVADNAKGGATLLFGRVTYDLMVSFWPTPGSASEFSRCSRTNEQSTQGCFF